MEKELKIINHFGLNNQIKKLSEEVLELIESILLDTGDEESYEHIREEWVDVKLLLNQIYSYYCFSKLEYKTEVMYDYKLHRTLGLVNYPERPKINFEEFINTRGVNYD